MSKFDKLIKKIMEERSISYDEAETLLIKLGFDVGVRGSHHVFRKDGFDGISLKRRSQLISYQMKLLKRVLKDHGY